MCTCIWWCMYYAIWYSMRMRIVGDDGLLLFFCLSVCLSPLSLSLVLSFLVMFGGLCVLWDVVKKKLAKEACWGSTLNLRNWVIFHFSFSHHSKQLLYTQWAGMKERLLLLGAAGDGNSIKRWFSQVGCTANLPSHLWFSSISPSLVNVMIKPINLSSCVHLVVLSIDYWIWVLEALGLSEGEGRGKENRKPLCFSHNDSRFWAWENWFKQKP